MPDKKKCQSPQENRAPQLDDQRWSFTLKKHIVNVFCIRTALKCSEAEMLASLHTMVVLFLYSLLFDS